MKNNFKKYIQEICEEYRMTVFAGEYSMEIEFSEKEDNSNWEITHAAIIVDSKYLKINITIYPILKKYWKEKRFDELKKELLHEFCHILIDPVYFIACDLKDGKLYSPDNINETRERQTQRTTNVIWNLLNKDNDNKNTKKTNSEKRL